MKNPALITLMAALFAGAIAVSCLSSESKEELDQEYETFGVILMETVSDGIVTQDEAHRLELGYRNLGGKITIALAPDWGDRLINGLVKVLEIGGTAAAAVYAVRRAPNSFLLGKEYDPAVAKVATPPTQA